MAVDFRAGSNVDISVSKAITAEQIEPIVKESVLMRVMLITPGDDRMNIRFTMNWMRPRDESNLKQEI